MPLIDIKIIEGTFSEEEIEKLIKDVTDVIVSSMGENLRSYTLGSSPGSKEWKLGGRWAGNWIRGSKGHARGYFREALIHT